MHGAAPKDTALQTYYSKIYIVCIQRLLTILIFQENKGMQSALIASLSHS